MKLRSNLIEITNVSSKPKIFIFNHVTDHYVKPCCTIKTNPYEKFKITFISNDSDAYCSSWM